MIEVAKIKCVGGYRLRATFSDGMAGEYDFSAIVGAGGPMAEPLRDPAFFGRVFLEDGAPTWPTVSMRHRVGSDVRSKHLVRWLLTQPLWLNLHFLARPIHEISVFW